jgi:hypothetical protein
MGSIDGDAPGSSAAAARAPLLYWVILVVVVCAASEVAAALASAVLVARGAMVDVPRLSDDEIAMALARRSTLLGWGPATDDHGRVLHLAPRPDPAFPAGRPPCVSVYGDSFTLGAGDDATYPHDLARALGCAVDNYGVGGYGSDQALMLFEAQRQLDRAPVVILGHLAENVLRNVNQYQGLLYPESRIRFKPRFLLEDGQLRWLPLPVADADAYHAIAARPERFLTHDAFVDRPRPRFPYTLHLVRWLLDDSYARSRLARSPWHAAFYAPDHPSGALPLTVRILTRFAADARADGREPVVFLVPTRSDLAWARRTGRWTDQPLADALVAAGVRVVHAGPALATRLGDRDLGGLFVADGHPNAAGYALLADVLGDGLARLGVVATPERASR